MCPPPNAHTSEDSELSLARTLRALRNELQQAKLDAEGSNFLFEIDKVDVEFKVQISEKTTAKGGIDFHIIKAGADLANGEETTHTIKLSLKVLDAKEENLARVRGRLDHGDLPANQ